MELRDPAMPPGHGPAGRPEEPLRPAVAPAGQAAGPGTGDRPVDEVSYRVDARFTALKIVGVVVCGLVALAFSGDPLRTAFAGLAAAVLAGYALRDLIAPVRLAADRTGVTLVAGYAARRRLTWADIERVRLDRHSRFGLRAEYVEIDTGETLYLFSTYDLAAHPHAVVNTLLALRGGARQAAR